MKLYGNLSKNGQAVVSMMVTLIRELDNYKTYLDQSSGSDGYYGQVLLERRGEKLNNLRNGNHYVTQGLDSVIAAGIIQTLSWKDRKIKHITRAWEHIIDEVLCRLIPLLGGEDYCEE